VGVANDLVAGPAQPLGHVAAHAAQPDHAHLHGQASVIVVLVRALGLIA
jgi:hypothetical protein